MNDHHEANRKGWDAVSPGWQANIDAQGIWRRCHREPELVLTPEEMEFLRDVAGKDVCVLGSGDNVVAFALAGMGARVTSVDISQVQLDTAAHRARELGLEMQFLRADVTDLSALADETSDLVYTGGHVAVWVSDLNRYYAEACRILKPWSLFVVNEYHPFRRIWQWGVDRLELECRYFDRGPFEYDRSDMVGGAEPGSLPSFEFHWTVSDYVSAMVAAGCELVSLKEFGDGREEWEGSALEGLPLSLLVVGRKLAPP